ncbi:hypothetical protein Pmani_012981 [Petrolisthes manimaculis]|uniref:Suppressor APC domain-containing protein n=1 Tax=Petrolisthes manimaculis TaxID=1843537 RepID=A0AAE1PVY2_9EUCA|nr:hypothetical protein Pmani_012981 [Petrolisthes manimaculis]
MTATQTGASALDGLPKSFVSSMRTLFDIMDDQRSGFVKFSEIERRWQDDGRQGLPRGVLSSLRKVTPLDGYLSFERFCAGLQISLLRNKMDDRPGEDRGSNMIATLSQPPFQVPPPGPPPPQPPPPPLLHNRPPSAPILDQQDGGVQQHMRAPTSGPGPNHTRAERAISLPQLIPPDPHPPIHPSDSHPPLHRLGKPDIKMGVGGVLGRGGAPPGPPKPPRALDRDTGGTHSLDRNLDGRAHPDHRATHSLDRDRSRDHCPLRDRDRGEAEMRRERGWSLERYLDGPEASNGPAGAGGLGSGAASGGQQGGTGVPLRRAGIRSALQTWHKERTRPEPSNRPDQIRPDPSTHLDPNYVSHREYREARPVAAAGGREDTRDRRRDEESRERRREEEARERRRGEEARERRREEETRERRREEEVRERRREEEVRERRRDGEAVSAGMRGVGDGAGVQQQDPTISVPSLPSLPSTSTTTAATHKKSSRKREPRRHTLQNGIDANMLRRLKQLEAERDMLIQGYEVVERARGWYRQQLHGISERIHYLPHSTSHTQEPSLEAQQEKLHFQLARIHEVNSHLQALMDASERGLASHINLAIHSASSHPLPQPSSASAGEAEERERMVVRLKEQNHLLTEEVSNKSERITVLEREKAALLRELFQARSTTTSNSAHLHHHHHSALHPASAAQDSTFM